MAYRINEDLKREQEAALAERDKRMSGKPFWQYLDEKYTAHWEAKMGLRDPVCYVQGCPTPVVEIDPSKEREGKLRGYW